MNARDTLILAALKVLEEGGEATFSTRSVLSIAGLSAPTLYHHFGNADGLLSAAMTEAFEQFLNRKHAAEQGDDAIAALTNGWDDYVLFAAERPRLYAAMLSRVLAGGEIPAARQAFDLLRIQLRRIEVDGQLATDVESAADWMWASVNSASLLFVTAHLRGSKTPTNNVLKTLRDGSLNAILRQQKD
jgi:AcrR family transcriptional regulator